MNSIVQPSISNTPSPEVQEIKRRRTISPAEKRRILQAYDGCKDLGERGALLRRERVYSSMLSNWRKQVRTTAVSARRGPKVNPAVAQRHRDVKLTSQVVRLQRQLDRANLIIEAQKKLCALLGVPSFEEQQALDK
jgi:transposase